MHDKNDSNLILLTYKEKALLMYKYESSIDETEHEWTFPKTIKKSSESIKEGLMKVVFKEAGIKIGNIRYIGRNFYHAQLSDNDVNSIKRKELQLINFFTLNEVKKLNLSPLTKNFVNQHGNLI